MPQATRRDRTRAARADVQVRGVEPRPWTLFAGAMLAALACAIVFRAGLHGELLDWDDEVNLVDNPAWRGLGARNLAWMFTTFHHGPYQPLTWLTFGCDWVLTGLDPVALHRTNLVFHAAAAAAFFAAAHVFLAAVFPAARAASVWTGALCAALFFGAHPMRVESVAWVTERRDVVSGVFYALTLLFWVRHAREPRSRWGRDALLACACFVLALLGKGTGMFVPFAFFVLDLVIARRDADGEPLDLRARVLEKLPFVALGLVFAGVALYGQWQLGSAMSGLEHYPFTGRVLQTIVGTATYPAQTALLVETSPFHPHPGTLGAFAARDFVPVAALAVVLVVAWFARARGVVFAWLAFVIVAFPILGLAQTGPQLTADRYSYLSCLPFALLLGAVIPWAARWRNGAFVAGALAIALCGRAAARAHELVPVWHDDAALWRRATVVHADALVPWRKLSVVLTDRARAAADVATRRALLAETIETCRAGLREVSDPGLANNAMFAASLLAEADPEHAEQHQHVALAYSKAASEMSARAPTPSLEAELNYPRLLRSLKRMPEARTAADALVARRPDVFDAHLLAGQIHAQLKQWNEAVPPLERAVLLAPENFDAWVELGIARRYAGRPDDALDAFRRAIELGTRPGAQPGMMLDVARLHAGELERSAERKPR